MQNSSVEFENLNQQLKIPVKIQTMNFAENAAFFRLAWNPVMTYLMYCG